MTYRTHARESLKAKNAEIGREFQEIPQYQWPPFPWTNPPVRAWRNSQFFVQQFDEPDGVIRLSIIRSALKGFRKDNSPIWQDGLTWDELQAIKTALGFGDRWAVELYPPEVKVVNVANMRHLWLLPEPPAYGWHKGGG